MTVVAQFAVSLLAIMMLAWLARRLGLGRDVQILDEDHARFLAGDVLFGFEASDIAVDEYGRAALVKDQSGTMILVKVHGAQFSGRVLGPDSTAAIWVDLGKKSLEVYSGERLFGKAFLDIAKPEKWAEAINAFIEPAHA